MADDETPKPAENEVDAPLPTPAENPTTPVDEPAEPVAPTPEIPTETPPEIQPEPAAEPAPTPQPDEIPTPPVTPPVTVPTPTLPPPEPEQPSVSLDISQLTDDQLKAAAALWAKKNQAEFSKKGVAKRKVTMELNLRAVVDYLSHNNGAPLPRIARHTNITAGTTSKYLRQLIAAGKVRAEGWAKDRRYYLK